MNNIHVYCSGGYIKTHFTGLSNTNIPSVKHSLLPDPEQSVSCETLEWHSFGKLSPVPLHVSPSGHFKHDSMFDCPWEGLYVEFGQGVRIPVPSKQKYPARQISPPRPFNGVGVVAPPVQ